MWTHYILFGLKTGVSKTLGRSRGCFRVRVRVSVKSRDEFKTITISSGGHLRNEKKYFLILKKSNIGIYVEIGRRSQLLPSFNFSLLVSDCSDHMETRHWVSVKRGVGSRPGPRSNFVS